jgi:hypothetical protein
MATENQQRGDRRERRRANQLAERTRRSAAFGVMGVRMLSSRRFGRFQVCPQVLQRKQSTQPSRPMASTTRTVRDVQAGHLFPVPVIESIRRAGMVFLDFTTLYGQPTHDVCRECLDTIAGKARIIEKKNT